MKKLLLILIFLIFSCQNEYVEFHNAKNSELQTQKEISNFSFDQIEYLTWLTLKKTPDLDFLDELTTKIDASQKRVYVEVYIFTEKRLKKSLIDAKKRWVDVRVVLEKNIYLAWNLNKDTFKDLEKNGIEVVYSNQENYSLNHSKLMIIDDLVVISTGNFSYSTFKYNREFFLLLEKQKYLEVFLDIFQNDFLWNKKNISNWNLVLSPFSSRTKLEYLLENAQSSIKMYVHNISDNSIINKIIDKNTSWVDVKILLPDLKKVSSNENEIEIFKNNKINYKLIDKPEIHAKTILIDEKYLYIWSINFSQASMDKNREIWLLIKNEEIIKDFLAIFNDDFEK